MRCIAWLPLGLALVGRTAAAATPERPALPSWSLAGEDGALSLWSNPANLSIDPDGSWAVLYSQEAVDAAPAELALAGDAGPLGLGLRYFSGSADGSLPPWWTFSSGLSFRLDRQLSVGAHLGVQRVDGADGFATWDLGTTWRPLHWLGVSAVAQNMGVAEQGVSSRFGPGLALRPFGDKLMLGGEYLVDNGPGVEGLAKATLSARPVDGLTLRLSGTSEGEVGGGLELYFGGAGGGGHVSTGLDAEGSAPLTSVYAQSASPSRRLVGGGRKVPEIRVEGSYPYRPVGGLFGRAEESYLGLYERLVGAAKDPAVAGLVLRFTDSPFSQAQTQELIELVEAAQARGKIVVVYLERTSSSSAYLLGAAADKVYLHPAGELELVGLSVEQQFLKGPMDLVGIGAQYARRSEFKSAPEMFTRGEPSGPARDEMNVLLDDMAKAWAQGIAKGRGLPEEAVWTLVDNGPYTAAEALEKGLVDKLIYPDELGNELDGLFDENYNRVDDYLLTPAADGWRGNKEIAVVVVDGSIISGESSSPGFFGGGSSSGSDTVVRQLEQARSDDSVLAVVMRVDSPGGSAFASDEIWRAVERLKEADKPVIVSMGGMAASGGYYVSAGATAIYALPSTITGSIGVYSGKYNLEGLYEKVGLNYEIYRRGRKAAMWSMSKPMDDVEFAAMDHMVGETYAMFKARVGAGRGLPPEKVEEVARGRVWSGAAAQGQGLVDQLGGFDAAVQRARVEAGISEKADVALVSYGSRPGPDGELASRELRSRLATTLMGGAPRLNLPPELQRWMDLGPLANERVLMMMPYTIEVE